VNVHSTTVRLVLCQQPNKRISMMQELSDKLI